MVGWDVALGRAWQCVVWSWLRSRGAADGRAGGPGGGRRWAASAQPQWQAAGPRGAARLGATSTPSQQRPSQLVSVVPSNHSELEVSGMLITAQLNISL